MMEQQLDLLVEYKGKQQTYKATLVVYAYSYKFYVEINGQVIIFEPDESRNYRATLRY